MTRLTASILSFVVLAFATDAAAQCQDDKLRKADCDQQRCISLIDREHLACEAAQRCNDRSLTPEELSKRLAQDLKCVQYNTDARGCFKSAASHPASQVATIKDWAKECEAATKKK